MANRLSSRVKGNKDRAGYDGSVFIFNDLLQALP